MRSLLIAALGGLPLLAGIGSAGAWERHVTVDTHRGTISGSSEVYCFAGACYRERELTGRQWPHAPDLGHVRARRLPSLELPRHGDRTCEQFCHPARPRPAFLI